MFVFVGGLYLAVAFHMGGCCFVVQSMSEVESFVSVLSQLIVALYHVTDYCVLMVEVIHCCKGE